MYKSCYNSYIFEQMFMFYMFKRYYDWADNYV